MGSQEDERRELEEEGLLSQDKSEGLYTGDGSVDINGNPILKNGTGDWRACPFILGTECCERLAYYGISTNLVTYLTKKLHEGNVSAARNVTTWQGTCYIAPLIGAVLADAYWGRYWTIAVFSTIYFIGMSTLTLSASVPAFKPPPCVGSICPKATVTQYVVFFLGLYGGKSPMNVYSLRVVADVAKSVHSIVAPLFLKAYHSIPYLIVSVYEYV